MRTHPQEVVDAALALIGRGAGVCDVARVITARGFRLSESTVRYWINERGRSGRRVHGRMNEEQVLEAGELWEAGLSFTAIAVVLGRYHGVQVAPDTIRNRLPNRTRRPRGSQVGLVSNREAA